MSRYMTSLVASVLGRILRRRPGHLEANCAVVIQRGVDRAAASEDYPGWVILQPGDPLAGHRFDHVVILLDKQPRRPVSHVEYEIERAWLGNLHNKMKPGGSIVTGIRVSRK